MIHSWFGMLAAWTAIENGFAAARRPPAAGGGEAHPEAGRGGDVPWGPRGCLQCDEGLSAGRGSGNRTLSWRLHAEQARSVYLAASGPRAFAPCCYIDSGHHGRCADPPGLGERVGAARVNGGLQAARTRHIAPWPPR